jgi:hypothetical protein
MMVHPPPSLCWRRGAATLGERILGCQLTHQRVTRLLTGSAGLSTHTTVLHAVLSMSLALVTAKAAGGRARLQSGRDDLRLQCCLARDDAACCVTEIGTIEIEPDAARERFRVGLAQTRISARRTGLRAVETGADAGQECVTGDNRLRTRLDHGLCETHWDSSKQPRCQGPIRSLALPYRSVPAGWRSVRRSLAADPG